VTCIVSLTFSSAFCTGKRLNQQCYTIAYSVQSQLLKQAGGKAGKSLNILAETQKISIRILHQKLSLAGYRFSGTVVVIA